MIKEQVIGYNKCVVLAGHDEESCQEFVCHKKVALPGSSWKHAAAAAALAQLPW